MKLDEAMRTVPVVAILRGVTPDEIEAHAEALHAGGVRIVEIPLNSPEPFESLRRLTERWGDRLVCGSGTVLSPDMVDHVAEARGRIVVAPNTNPWSTVAYGLTAADVRHTVVDGRVLLRDRELTTIDERAVLDEITALRRRRTAVISSSRSRRAK